MPDFQLIADGIVIATSEGANAYATIIQKVHVARNDADVVLQEMVQGRWETVLQYARVADYFRAWQEAQA